MNLAELQQEAIKKAVASGGPHGYAEMMEITRNPTHPEYKNVKIWLGKGFNPRKFDLKLVNKRLSLTLL